MQKETGKKEKSLGILKSKGRVGSKWTQLHSLAYFSLFAKLQPYFVIMFPYATNCLSACLYVLTDVF
jgi:DMSO/TMAO reductase YedYZ heme-binding membrane subunit